MHPGRIGREPSVLNVESGQKKGDIRSIDLLGEVARRISEPEDIDIRRQVSGRSSLTRNEIHIHPSGNIGTQANGRCVSSGRITVGSGCTRQAGVSGCTNRITTRASNYHECCNK